MSGAASVGILLNVTADLNYYTMQLNEWSAKYEANSEKLQKQVKAEDKYIDAYDDAINHGEGDKELKAGGKKWVAKDQTNVSKKTAEGYAHAKAKNYDESLSLELAELDIEYDTMKTLYEALVTQKQAEKDSDKQNATTQLQDTHLLQS